MALSPKKRERIIEEEQLRFEIRQTLMREHCAKNRPSRFLWWVAIAALIFVAFSWHCGSHGCSLHSGPHCAMPGAEEGYSVAPGQPLPPKK